MSETNNEQYGFWRKDYWRSALICLIIAGTLSQMSPKEQTPEAVLPLLLQQAANLGCLVFLVAGISRAISNRTKR